MTSQPETKPAAQRGRPRFDPAFARTERLHDRLTPAEKEELTRHLKVMRSSSQEEVR
jgi:hypothetical protein